MTSFPRDLTCRELVEFLAEYLTGELPVEERAPFEAHLAACPECRTYLTAYRHTVEAARDACTESDELPRDLPEALVRAVRAARTPRRRGAPRRR